MPVFSLTNELIFLPVHLAERDGLLAVGGDLSVKRLLLAYRSGIFPWYDKPPILWWSPDPRFVLFPKELKISKSMRQVLRKQTFTITVNKAFAQVMSACKCIARQDQQGSWINNDLQAAYEQLHKLGWAVSVEAWQGPTLAGGLYGVKIGHCFFGESMFAKISNASKTAFITYVLQLQEEGCQLIDCQVYTAHLQSLGARMIPRSEFISLLQHHL